MARKRQLSEREQAELELKSLLRLAAVKRAQASLLEFAKLMMPDPRDPDDPRLSRYAVARLHKIIAAELEAVEAGTVPRLIITVPPRHGKSQLTSKIFPAWFMGRDPYRQVIVASYSANMAEDFGRAVRGFMQTAAFQQVFPECELIRGGAAADRIETTQGGIGAFAGVGGGLTGKGADVLLIDDPIKDREEANSPTIREKQWEWFLDVAMTRLMGGMGRAVIIMTRWHEDDLVGRLTDPNNPCYNAEEAKLWKVVSLAALAEEDDILGREKDEALWPERVTQEFLFSQRRLNPRGFAALYQGRPAPEEGIFFTAGMLRTYQPDELPANLRMYCASDHAVSTQQDRDPTVLLAAGVDENDNLWIMPDAFWRRAPTDVVVEAMVEFMGRHQPLMWWAERGHISKSIAPFLRKRMHERRIYAAINEVVPVKDKMTRAQAINGRMAMGKVFFPAFAPWWEKARQQMLAFPAAKHDDFVDALAYFGLGLGRMVRAQAEKPKEVAAEVGSLAWVKARSERERRLRKIRRAAAGF